MKETPQDHSLDARLAASKFSGDGFLGHDHRPVDEIITEDLRTLDRLRIEKETLHGALADAFEKARAALGGRVDIRPGLSAIAHESMGRIPSPFRGDGMFEKGDVMLTDSATGDTLILTALGLFLIHRHGFFQGHGSRYRIDPTRAARLLDLRPEEAG
ncbi:MAG: hypothetical protein PHO14_03615 [Kiritimatiellae bacterium]|nr:hypothetical protein [Kiritimatiellia bacterium]MDD4341304.1 hypothetical protein [Kiritimatiellia bacterium]